MKKVVVGLSGGVDSFVAALLLQQQGYEVIGVHLQLWGKTETTAVEVLCKKLELPLLCREGQQLLTEAVIDPFIGDYASGRTPSPCCRCNRWVKWKLLQEVADECQADCIATGHYVRIGVKEGNYYIRKGADPVKEQSYFLWGMPQEILARAVTPLGKYTKAEIKRLAYERGYAEVAGKKESMGICFLQGRDYREFLRAEGYGQEMPGWIVNRAGEVIGEHTGIWKYTVGQKRGMPVVDGAAMYVAEIHPRENIIVADGKTGLWTRSLQVEQVVAVCKEELEAPDVTIRIRGLGLNPGGFVKTRQRPEGNWEVELTEPAWAVAPGQPVAFYRGDWLVGGGTIQGNAFEREKGKEKENLQK